VKRKRHLAILFMFLVIGFANAQKKSADLPEHKGLYFGLKPPGQKAEIFAKDIITYEPHASPTISPDGKEMIIDSMGEGSKYYRMIDNRWTLQPDLPFALPGVCNGVFLSPSGNAAYFFIWENNENAFYMSKKKGEKWSELQPLGKEVNSFKASWQLSTAENENLYFSYEGNVMVAVYDGNKYSTPEYLKLEENGNLRGVTPFIAPDESYLIYSLGYKVTESDLYISYRMENNTWTKPTNLGDAINVKDNMDLCPMISPDGKVLFFISRRPGPDYGLYWVDAGFIEDLKAKILK
jgi:hypothetical protein